MALPGRAPRRRGRGALAPRGARVSRVAIVVVLAVPLQVGVPAAVQARGWGAGTRRGVPAGVPGWPGQVRAGPGTSRCPAPGGTGPAREGDERARTSPGPGLCAIPEGKSRRTLGIKVHPGERPTGQPQGSPEGEGGFPSSRCSHTSVCV